MDNLPNQTTKALLLPKLVRYWAPFLLWASVIFLFSTMPTTSTSEVHWEDFIIKKSAHMIEYGVFAMLLYRALKEFGYPKTRLFITVLLVAVAYGASDELHQSFTPGREPRLRDVVIDTIGATFSLWIITRWLPTAPKKLQKWARDLQLI